MGQQNISRLTVLCLALSACVVGELPGGDSDDKPTDTSEPDGPDAFVGCNGDSEAHKNFNAFWKTIDERYAVFDVRLSATSWKQIGSSACEEVDSEMSDDELFDLLIAMAENLDDGHTTLTATALGRDEDAEITIYPHYAQVATLEDLIEGNYLNGDFATGAEDEISWGMIGAVGFISITSMDELSASGDEDDDALAARVAMTSAIAALQASDAIVVDVRANEGGWDAVSLEIAAWFAGPRQLAWSEQVRNGPEHNEFAAPSEVCLEEGRLGAFSGPVVVLTSGGTYSAAETFVLAIGERELVTVLGERTSGHLSDMIEATLPNGWDVTFSGERYLAANGELFEEVGVPPDVSVAIDISALSLGTDNMLEAALAQITSK